MDKGSCCNAEIRIYALEQVRTTTVFVADDSFQNRVLQVPRGERTFDILHMIAARSTKEPSFASHYHIPATENCALFQGSTATQGSDTNASENIRILQANLAKLGLSDTEIDEVFRLLSAVLVLHRNDSNTEVMIQQLSNLFQVQSTAELRKFSSLLIRRVMASGTRDNNCS